MRTILKTLFIFLPFIIMVFAPYSCEDRYVESYQANVPVYLGYDEFRSAVKPSDVRPLHNPGKLYFYEDYIFIVEDREGFHVIDNSDPENPQNLRFVEVPGNVDVAVKDNVLYADSYTDLVAIDISDLSNIREIGREEDIFPYTLPPFNDDYKVAAVDEEKGVVINWKIEKVKEEVEQTVRYPIYPWYGWPEMDMLSSTSYIRYNGSSSDGNATFGIGGSMARITIVGNVLYALGNSSLRIFDITDAADPEYNGITTVTNNAETVFPYKNYLFIGTQTGMFVYDISTLSNPKYISNYSHWQSCDPVVVEDDYAYVTLRSGTVCWTEREINELQVLDISNVEQPQFVKSYEMHNPHGLGIDNNTLFVCDGDKGLKVYDAVDKYAISSNQIAEFNDIHAFDVIPLNGNLLLIGEDGFHQYSYQNLPQVTFLSSILVENSEE